jgi:uncharacterized protein DUF397
LKTDDSTVENDEDPAEAGWLHWRTATFSGQVECVAVANLDGTVGVRNTRDPKGPTLIVPRPAFGLLVERAKAGEYDDLVYSTDDGSHRSYEPE